MNNENKCSHPRCKYIPRQTLIANNGRRFQVCNKHFEWGLEEGMKINEKLEKRGSN